MKQIILLIFILITSIQAQSFQLSDKDLKYIKANPYKKAIYLRIKKYTHLLQTIKTFPIEKKLNYINSFYNKILPVQDSRKYKSDDYWATPKEFLIEGHGDCEEYAISKYFALKEVGVEQDKLFLSVVKVKGSTNYHMILLYLKNKKAMPLVLDNLSFKVLAFNKRTDLIPKFIFNEKEAYILKNKKIYKKVRINWGKTNKWDNLLKRIYEKKE